MRLKPDHHNSCPLSPPLSLNWLIFFIYFPSLHLFVGKLFPFVPFAFFTIYNSLILYCHGPYDLLAQDLLCKNKTGSSPLTHRNKIKNFLSFASGFAL